MTKKFRNKYRIPSTRLQNWDYRWAGAYFITICTQNRKHYFGKIENRKMELSPIGAIANVLWHEIKNHSQNIALDEFVVMPNHIHGILILNGMDPDQGNDGHGDGNNFGGNGGNADMDIGDNWGNVGTIGTIGNDGNDGNVETGRALSLRTPTPSNPQLYSNSQPVPKITIGQKRFQNIGNNSVSSIIGSYKSAVTKHSRRLGYEFAWQPRFYDHIIRDSKSFETIKSYIAKNPFAWQKDKFNAR